MQSIFTSYDVIVKAGFDFTQVEWSENSVIIDLSYYVKILKKL